MIIQNIKFTDVITGEEESKDFLFHLNKADLVRVLGKVNGENYEQYIQGLVASRDIDTLMDVMESLVKTAVGKRTPDGKFIKPKEYGEEFVASEAYGELFVKLISEEGFAEQFVNGMVSTNGIDKPKLQSVGGNRRNRRNNKNRNN